MLLPEFYVDDVIKRALSEDINYIDLATDLLILRTKYPLRSSSPRLRAFWQESTAH